MFSRTSKPLTILTMLAAVPLLAGCPGDDSSSSSDDASTTGDATTSSTTMPDPSATGMSVGNDSSGGGSTGTTVADTTGGTMVDPTTGEPVVCGDGVVAGAEACDDGNTDDGDGCSAGCEVDVGWECDGADPTTCMTVCGDMLVGAPVEECDDGNMDDTDDCTNACLNAACGDGIVWVGNEGCDDGAAMAGDGCDDLCAIEPGYLCDGTPSLCEPGIFLADGAEGVIGSLYVMSLDGTTTMTLGPLSVSLTGMAFHPDGTLYAVTSVGGGGPGQLGTIDLTTVTFNVVGPLVDGGGTPRDRMPDIAFMGTQLVGWTESGDDLALIDTATGLVTVVPAPEGSFGTGLAYNSLSDEILVAPDGSGGPLWTVTPMGMMSAGPTLGGALNTVKGLSYYDGLLYGLDGGFPGPTSNVVTYDPATGAMMTLGASPALAVDAVAVLDPNNIP